MSRISQHSSLGSRNSELGTRNSVLGTRNSVLGTPNLEYDAFGQFLQPEWRPWIDTYLETHDATPFRADLDITSQCNYACVHCGDLAKKLLNRGGLSWSELLEILEDFTTLKVNEVCLIGGGEPTVSPHYENVLEELSARGIRVSVTTNGSLFSESRALRTANTADWVRFSIDAATEPTYALLHRPLVPTPLATIHRNLRTLAALMPGRVGVSFLIMKINTPEIVLAARQARDLGAAHVRFRLVNHPITGEILRLSDPELVLNALHQAKKYEDRYFQVSIPDATLKALHGETKPTQTKTYCHCHAQAFTTTIAGDGNVYVCSKWRGEPWACIGNVRRERLVELWRGERRRRVLSELNPSQRCANVFCHAHPHNLFLEGAQTAPKEEPPNTEITPLTPRFDEPSEISHADAIHV